jgi:hypothetical protein
VNHLICPETAKSVSLVGGALVPCDARILLRGVVSVSDTYRIPILLGYTSDTYPSRTKKIGYFMVGILISDTVVST